MNYLSIKCGASVILLSFLSSCNKDECVSCIAQSPDQQIIEHRVICDKHDSAREGFEDGMRARYAAAGDSVSVLCSQFEPE